MQELLSHLFIPSNNLQMHQMGIMHPILRKKRSQKEQPTSLQVLTHMNLKIVKILYLVKPLKQEIDKDDYIEIVSVVCTNNNNEIRYKILNESYDEWVPRPKVNYLAIPYFEIPDCTFTLENIMFIADPGSIYITKCADSCETNDSGVLEGAGVYSR